MGLQTLDPSPEKILQRIDAIMHELEELRKEILHFQVKPPTGNLAQKLYGVLGRGNWDEYDLDLDWQKYR